MFIRFTYASTVFFLASHCFAASDEWKSEADIPLARCDLPNLMMYYSWKTLAGQLAMGDIKVPMAQEMNAIAKKAKDKNKPIGEQLGTKDLSRFNELSHRMLSISMQGLVESKRLRDVKFIKQLVMIADRNYRFGEELPEGHSDYIYQATLATLRAMGPGLPEKEQHQVTFPDAGSCSFNFALHMVEMEPIKKMAALNLAPELEKLQRIANKNGVTRIDPAKLNKDDRESYDAIMNDTAWPAQHAQQFIDDMEYIKVMAKASDLIYVSSKRDLEISGGDGTRIGMTVAELAKKGEISNFMQAAIGLWYGINEKIPSDATKEALERAKIAK